MMNSNQFEPIAAALPWSIRAAETLLRRRPILADRWHYEPGVALLALQKVWEQTRERHYLEYIQLQIDQFVDSMGNIHTYTLEEYNLDQINEGKVLFTLYAETGIGRYKQAVHLLREQLRTHPRTPEGGFWHKLIYPHQMWLDGLYMAGPFLAQFGKVFDEPELFADIARQVELFDRCNRDSKTGLLYHGWDSSRRQSWAHPQTGCSPNFWARAIGWFAMALPDILEYYPENHPSRNFITMAFNATMDAVLAVQDEASGVWYQIIDQGNRPGNYLEASAACMFVYALVKGVRLGYLDASYLLPARRGYQGILDQFITVDGYGWVNLHGICGVGGLGGNPYRDGTFEYYISERVVSNDEKGVGPFIMASVEIERDGEQPGDER